jgi:hypothetical protein
MSEAGALSNMYEKYKDLCQLVDQVLLDINMGRSGKDDPNRVKLVGLLDEIIQKKEDHSIGAGWGELLLDDINYNLNAIKRLKSILSDDPFQDDVHCQVLEDLAWRLESKRTKMYAKMRGAGF